MAVTIGIDIGGSATKVVGFEKGSREMMTPALIEANDALGSMYGAFGKFIFKNNLAIADVERVMITGVGASYVRDSIFGITTGYVDEFISIGLGGQYLTGLKRAVVVSMGTGTAFVSALGDEMAHLGGSGVGGGTIVGLSKRLVGTRYIDNIIDLSKTGDISKVDLSIKDISEFPAGELPNTATASNFGKLSDMATYPDIARGILNMVFETIGVLSRFAAQNVGCNDVVLTGKLSTIEQCGSVMDSMAKWYGVNYIIPEYAEFATACGAALSAINGFPYRDIAR